MKYKEGQYVKLKDDVFNMHYSRINIENKFKLISIKIYKTCSPIYHLVNSSFGIFVSEESIKEKCIKMDWDTGA